MFANLDDYQKYILLSLIITALITLVNFIVTCLSADNKECNKKCPKPDHVRRMPKYYVGAKVMIRDYIFDEHNLGHLELESFKGKEFEIVDIYNTVDRGISYKILRKEYVTTYLGDRVLNTAHEFVVPEHYLKWSTTSSILFYADGDVINASF